MATQSEVDSNNSQRTSDASSSSTEKVSETESLKQHLEETRRTNEVRKMLLGKVVYCPGIKLWPVRSAFEDWYFFLQSMPNVLTLYSLHTDTPPCTRRLHRLLSFFPLGGNPAINVSFDFDIWMQSNICVKQLAYGAQELLIISVFPELRKVVIDIHKQMCGKPVV